MDGLVNLELMFKFLSKLSPSADQASLDLVGINFLTLVSLCCVEVNLLDLGYHEVAKYL
jgi:hypothetical protein